MWVLNDITRILIGVDSILELQIVECRQIGTVVVFGFLAVPSNKFTQFIIIYVYNYTYSYERIKYHMDNRLANFSYIFILLRVHFYTCVC